MNLEFCGNVLGKRKDEGYGVGGRGGLLLMNVRFHFYFLPMSFAHLIFLN